MAAQGKCLGVRNRSSRLLEGKKEGTAEALKTKAMRTASRVNPKTNGGKFALASAVVSTLSGSPSPMSSDFIAVVAGQITSPT